MKPSFSRLLLLSITALLLVGCSEKGVVNLPGGGSYRLQPSTALTPFEALQKVDIHFGERTETLIATIEVDKNMARFVGLTPFGHKLIEASYDNIVAHAEKMPDSRLEPEFLFAILQIALWPIDSVRAGFGETAIVEENCQPHVQQANHSPACQRRVRIDENMLIEIAYTGHSTPFEKLKIVYPYASASIEITTLEKNN